MPLASNRHAPKLPRRAGLVHDIGKVAVPDAILLKPARLTASERKIMQRHPLVGERICSPLKSFQLVLPIIRHHHEKMDGTGYPDKLKGEEIPLTARILQIVDVYDALTTSRPYKKALTVEEALGVMGREVKKGWWDSHVFAEFQRLIEKDVQKFISQVEAAAENNHCTKLRSASMSSTRLRPLRRSKPRSHVLSVGGRAETITVYAKTLWWVNSKIENNQ